jgi:hypothetical protein
MSNFIVFVNTILPIVVLPVLPQFVCNMAKKQQSLNYGI